MRAILRLIANITLISFIILFPSQAYSEKNIKPSTNIYGSLGLISSPNARHDKPGTIRFNISNTSPYLHTALGLQLAKSLYINLRQTSQTSSLIGDSKKMTPGIDFKLRLVKEGFYNPEISIGINSAIGHKKHSSEYIVFSKLIKNIDYTAGITWGRTSNKLNIKNPLSQISSHFEKERNYTNEETNTPNNWFTGQNMGIFAGIEYFTPIKNLSLKAEYNGEDYLPEKSSITNYKAPSPWAYGASYSPNSWSNISIGFIGKNQIFTKLSINQSIDNWQGKKHKQSKENIYKNIRIDKASIDKNKVNSQLYLSPLYSTPEQIKHVTTKFVKETKNQYPYTQIKLKKYGLQGPTIQVPTKKIILSKNNKLISPQEIWHETNIDNSSSQFKKTDKKFTFLGINPHELLNNKQKTEWNFILENKLSLSEENSGILYRTSIMAKLIKPLTNTAYLTISPRLNLKDNLKNIHKYKERNYLSARNNEDSFASTTISIDTMAISWLKTIYKDIHIAYHAGWLEEMYIGSGAEILYRPFNKRFAIGADTFLPIARNPNSNMNIKFTHPENATAHINLYYEIPNSDFTFKTSIGRFLAGDTGAKFELSKTFKNGTELETFFTITNMYDTDIFGGTTSLNHGIKLSFPIGNVKYIKEGSHIDFITAPIGRDIGQTIKNPMPLYELTNPLSSRHISNYWNDIIIND